MPGIYVISPQDELFVAASIPEKVLKQTPLTGQNRLHDQAMKGYRGVGVTTSVDGIQVLAAIAGIESTGCSWKNPDRKARSFLQQPGLKPSGA
jgi:hypothetical protein